MPKKIDPIERALDAYFHLDESQRRVFDMAIRHVARFTTGAFPKYVGTTAEPKPVRGRPPGSKNRKPTSMQEQDVDLVEKLFGSNGAVTEGL